MSWVFAQTTKQTFPKVDAIAFYTAGVLAKTGEWSDVYSASGVEQVVEMDSPPAGALPGAPLVFTLIEVETSKRYREAALDSGFPDGNAPAFAYLPVYAVVFQGLTAFSWERATFVWDLLNLFVFSLGLGVAVRASLPDRNIAGALLFASILVVLPVSHPFWFSMFCGQVTPMIVGASCLLMLPTGKRTGGEVLIGAAVCIVGLMKILPLLLFIPLLILGERKRAFGFIAAAVILCAASLLIAGVEPHYWMKTSAQALTQGVRHWSGNQSFEAFIYRFFFSTNLTQMPAVAVNPQPFIWLIALVKITFLVLLCRMAFLAKTQTEKRPLILASFILMLALLPHLSWSHYGLFALPVMVAAAGWVINQTASKSPLQRGLIIGTALVIGVFWGVDPDASKLIVERLTPVIGEVPALTLFRVAVGAPFLSMVGLLAFSIWALASKKITTDNFSPW